VTMVTPDVLPELVIFSVVEELLSEEGEGED
jgi:hypothetical protein